MDTIERQREQQSPRERRSIGKWITASGLVIAVIAAVVVAVLLSKGSGNKLEVVTAFDANLGELPEGITADAAGNIYVSMGAVGGPSGEIRRISPDGEQTTMAELTTAAAGMAVDSDGQVYFAYVTFDENGGVHRLLTDGTTEQLPGTGDMVLPNGLGFDDGGNLYVSDSVIGAVWRVPPEGAAEVWIQDTLLEGCPPAPDSDFPPVGANGVAYYDGQIYVANTDKGLLVRVPVDGAGGAGSAQVIAGDPGCNPTDPLFSMDGIALDEDGNVYALLVIQNRLVRIDPTNGDVTELLNGEGFHNPASLVFGTREGTRESLLIANYALLPPEPDPTFGPAVLSLDVGTPGVTVP